MSYVGDEGIEVLKIDFLSIKKNGESKPFANRTTTFLGIDKASVCVSMNVLLNDHIRRILYQSSSRLHKLAVQSVATIWTNTYVCIHICRYDSRQRIQTITVNCITSSIQLERAMPQAMGKGSSRRCFAAKSWRAPGVVANGAENWPKHASAPAPPSVLPATYQKKTNSQKSRMRASKFVVAPELLDLAVQLEGEHGTETQAMSEIVLPAPGY